MDGDANTASEEEIGTAKTHWRRDKPVLSMEEAVRLLGREMRSTMMRSYWDEITDLLEEKRNL
jgi:hypothetical protein